MEFLHQLLELLTEIGIIIFELIGVSIVLVTGIQGIVNYLKKRSDTLLKLAKGLSIGLEFKLGGEILRTVVARDWKDILFVGSIFLLRAAVTVLIHWEIKNEIKEEQMEQMIRENANYNEKN